MLWVLLLALLFQPIEPDNLETVTLEAGSGPVDVLYEVTEPQRLTVTVSAVEADADTPLDVTLEILQDDTRLAFNDDHGSDSPDLLPTDARIMDWQVLEAGTYTLRIHTFSGAQSGDVRVTVSAVPLLADCPVARESIPLRRYDRFTCTLTLTATDVVTITARDASGGLDPMLMLLTARGERAAFNDDHGTHDFTLNTLDARIAEFVPPSAGVYTLAVHDFGGMAGEIDLIIDISS
jgi:hypothetical protein